MDRLEELIAAARGELEVDLLIEGTRIANVLLGEVHRANVAVHKGRIVGFDCTSARQVLDLDGRILAPGIHRRTCAHRERHGHHSGVCARNSPKGHNFCGHRSPRDSQCMGRRGHLLHARLIQKCSFECLLMLPSCVPATSMETSGATLDAETLAKLIDHERVLGLAEVMNFPGVILRDPEVLKKSGWQEESAWTATLRGSPGATWLRISQLASSPTTSARAWKRRRRSCARECIS